jgi:hypothetical protein
MRKTIVSALLGIALVAVGGCATMSSMTSEPAPFILGVDTDNVIVFVDEENDKITLTGHVKSRLDKDKIEEYMRDERGYRNILNQITIQ